MRIFYAADTSPNSAIDSNLWRNNLYLSLADMGHEMVEFDYDLRLTFKNLASKKFIERNRERVSQELLRQIRAAHAAAPLDLFFSYFYDACVLPEAIDEIREMGIVTVNWFCNGAYQLDLVREISPHYDWCLVPEKFRLDDYRALGARPLYCQEAANPQIYRPYDLPVEYGATFAGQAYGERPAYIRYLLDQGIDIRVWGLWWRDYSPFVQQANRRNLPRRAYYIARYLATPEGRREALRRLQGKGRAEPDSCAGQTPPTGVSVLDTAVRQLPDNILGPVLSDEEMIKLYSRSRINLGFSSCGDTHKEGKRILQVRLRDFEVPMSGGFYMVEYMEELGEFFDIGKEIVCYSGPEDLAEKIKYYLAHDDEREAIRKAGYERCRRDHTWQKRFAAAFREMGLYKGGADR